MAWLPSSGTFVQTIVAVPEPDIGTTTVVSSSLNPATFGTDLAFTAVVTAEDDSIPTGSVQFYVDDAPLGPSITLSAGTVVIDVPGVALAVGDHVVEARFLP